MQNSIIEELRMLKVHTNPEISLGPQSLLARSLEFFLQHRMKDESEAVETVFHELCSAWHSIGNQLADNCYEVTGLTDDQKRFHLAQLLETSKQLCEELSRIGIASADADAIETADGILDSNGQDRLDSEFYDAPQSSANLPILLVTQRRTPKAELQDVGIVGELQVDLVSSLMQAKIRLGSLGLTTASSVFNEGVARACRLTQTHLGMRWTLKGYENFADNNIKLQLHVLDQRSVEAAFACALWAAQGKYPDGNSLAGDSLDRFATVTACLNEEDLSLGSKARLQIVGGLVEKAVAAIDCKLDMIIVAKGQLSNIERIRDSANQKTDVERLTERLERLPVALRRTAETTSTTSSVEFASEASHLKIIECATIGEAFEHLIQSSRISRQYTQAVLADWNSRFYEVDDDGNRLDGSAANS